MLFLFGDGYVAGDSPPAEQTPADFGNLIAWIDPRYNLTKSGGSVTAWTSYQDGYEHEGNIINAPTYESDGWNGQPSVLFNGSNNLVAFDDIAPLFAGNDMPFYMVASVQMVSSAASQTLWNLGNSTVGAFSVRLDINTSTLARYTVAKREGPPAGTQVLTASTSGDNTLQPQIISFIHDGTTIWLYINQVANGSVNGDAFDVGYCGFDRFTLGCGRGTSNSQFANVRFGPILIYANLTDDGRKQAEQWLIDQGYGYPAE